MDATEKLHLSLLKEIDACIRNLKAARRKIKWQKKSLSFCAAERIPRIAFL